MTNRHKIILITSFLAAVLPLFLVELPIIMDFPNHLARIWILSGGHLDGPLASVYQPDWTQASTNIAVDALGTALAHFLSLDIAAKILLVLLFIGPPVGAALLNQAVFKSPHAWQISFFILTWTTTSIAGFMSYQIGIAAAMLAAVMDHRIPGSSSSLFLRRTVTGMLLLVIHPFALLFFIALAWGFLVGEKAVWPIEKHRLIKMARATGLLAASAAIPLLALFFLSPNPPGSYFSTGPLIHWYLSAKGIFKSIASPFLTYQRDIDLILTFPILGVLLWSALFGKVRIHFGLALAAGILLILAAIAPSSIGDASWLQRRFPLMAALSMMAAVRPDLGLKRRREFILAAILLAALCVRAGWIANIWMERQSDIDSLYAATVNVSPGSSVLPILQVPAHPKLIPLGRIIVGCPYSKSEPVERHFPSLLVIRKQVFIPTLFSIPGQHTLKILPPWDEIAVGSSSVPSTYEFLWPSSFILQTDPYLRHWRSRFDYVLVFNADIKPPVQLSRLPDGLKLEKDAGYAKLYRVVR